MKIRKARGEDIRECVALSHIPEFPSLQHKNNKEMVKYFKEYISSGFILVAEENNKILGFIGGERMLGGVVWIDTLTVKNSERGKGVGKLLLNEMKKILKKQKVKSIYLMAPNFNKRTVNFYKSAGLLKGKEFVEFSQDL